MHVQAAHASRLLTHSRPTCVLLTHSSLVCVLTGSIPGPIAFGSMIDWSCLLWQRPCSQRGSCALYQNAAMSRYMLTAAVVFKVLASSVKTRSWTGPDWLTLDLCSGCRWWEWPSSHWPAFCTRPLQTPLTTATRAPRVAPLTPANCPSKTPQKGAPSPTSRPGDRADPERVCVCEDSSWPYTRTCARPIRTLRWSRCDADLSCHGNGWGGFARLVYLFRISWSRMWCV